MINLGRFKSKILIIGILLCFVLIGVDQYRKSNVIRISEDGLGVYDLCNPRKVVENSDLVFIGEIQSKKNTIYLYKDTPLTLYDIEVKASLKGNLAEGDYVEVYKDGGLSKNGYYLYLINGDILPEEGKKYIFLASRSIEPRINELEEVIIVSSPTMVIELNYTNFESIIKSEEYNLYKQIVNDQDDDG